MPPPRPSIRQFSQVQKDAAFENQERAGRISVASGLFAAVVAAIPGPGPFLAVAPALVGAAYGNRAIAQGRIVRDPPDPRFRVPVGLGRVKLDTSHLGDSGLEVSGGELALANEHAASAARAMVRAFERALGAEEAGEERYAEERLAQAEFFAGQLIDGLRAAATVAGDFAATVADLPRSALQELSSGLVLEHVLPDATLASLYRAGVRRGYVREPLFARGREWRSTGDFGARYSQLLLESAEADRAYAESTEVQLEAGTLFAG